MKVVMVNDCAFVGETLIKYLPEDFKVLHLKRSRRFFDKTFRIAWKILRSKGDIYHVHYLLQDCYLALKFGKHPVIGHAHGSDLRNTLLVKRWKWIVKYNLKHCSKILVSTPDLLESAKKYRDDIQYLPNPVDIQLFYPKPPEIADNKIRVLIASKCDWKLKGTDIVLHALSELKNKIEVFIIQYGKDFDRTIALARSLGLNLKVLPRVSHKRMREYYWMANVVVDQFSFGVLGMISLEAIACGRPVITFAASKHAPYKDFPLKDVKTKEDIVRAFNENLEKLWEKEYNYLVKNHDPQKVAANIVEIYETLSTRF